MEEYTMLGSEHRREGRERGLLEGRIGGGSCGYAVLRNRVWQGLLGPYYKSLLKGNDAIMMRATIEKAPSFWLSRGTREAFAAMKENLERGIGRRLKYEQFVRMLVDNADWIVHTIQATYDPLGMVLDGVEDGPGEE